MHLDKQLFIASTRAKYIFLRHVFSACVNFCYVTCISAESRKYVFLSSGTSVELIMERNVQTVPETCVIFFCILNIPCKCAHEKWVSPPAPPPHTYRHIYTQLITSWIKPGKRRRDPHPRIHVCRQSIFGISRDISIKLCSLCCAPGREGGSNRDG